MILKQIKRRKKRYETMQIKSDLRPYFYKIKIGIRHPSDCSVIRSMFEILFPNMLEPTIYYLKVALPIWGKWHGWSTTTCDSF